MNELLGRRLLIRVEDRVPQILPGTILTVGLIQRQIIGLHLPTIGLGYKEEILIIIIIIIRKFITRTCSQALSLNRRRGQSLDG